MGSPSGAAHGRLAALAGKGGRNHHHLPRHRLCQSISPTLSALPTLGVSLPTPPRWPADEAGATTAMLTVSFAAPMIVKEESEEESEEESRVRRKRNARRRRPKNSQRRSLPMATTMTICPSAA